MILQVEIWRPARVSLMYFNPIKFGSSISSRTLSWLHLSLNHRITSHSLEVSWASKRGASINTYNSEVFC